MMRALRWFGDTFIFDSSPVLFIGSAWAFGLVMFAVIWTVAHLIAGAW